jgi:hypothetical protein
VVGDDRLRAAGEDGGHPAAAIRQDAVADGKDTTMKGQQISASERFVHRPPGQPAFLQLPASDDAVLALCEGHDEG